MPTQTIPSYKDLLQFDIEELRSLNRTVVDVIKIKRDAEGREKSRQINVGDEITITSPRMIGQKFEVMKINSKKAVCKNKETGVQYNVPFNMIVTK